MCEMVIMVHEIPVEMALWNISLGFDEQFQIVYVDNIVTEG